MFYKAALPRVRLIRAAVVALVLTTLLGSLTSFPEINRKVGAAVPVIAAPANDNFRNAQPILPASGVVSGTTVGATKEVSEQNIEGVTGTGSVWYRWQAPFSGRFVFSTSGSDFNTMLGVYSGANLPGVQVATSDDDPLQCPINSFTPTLSRVVFDAVGGLVYHIAVDTKNEPGNFKLRWGRSGTITVQARSISNGGTLGAAKAAQLGGDLCISGVQGLFTFSGVPIGGNYTVSIVPFDPLGGYNFSPSNQNGSTSPLMGDVTLLYYLVSPAKTLSGRVTNLPGGPDITGLTVTCVSTNGALVTQTGKITVIGSFATFACSSLPINAQYLVTPTKLGFSFAPANATVLLDGDKDIANPFVATATSHTISGRVTHSDGTTGISGVTVALSGSETASKTTNANGDYSFTVLHGGNYSVTPSNSNFTFSPSNRSFTNVTAPETGDFTANFLLQLILDDMGQVAAVDSIWQTRDPFPVINNASVLNQGVDRNTRVAIFVSNFELGPGELPSSVVINLVGSNSQTYDIPADDVRLTSNPAITQVIFRLPVTLTPGICTLFVKARGLTSNIGAMRIKV